MNLAVAVLAVFVGFGVMSMAGLGAAILFIPIFYYSGVPLSEAISVGLLLNVVALGVATPRYVRARTVNVRLGLPILILAAAVAPIGAQVSNTVNRNLLLVLFAGFLVASGGLMLFYRRPGHPWAVSRPVEIGSGVTVGSGVGFLAGLLGVGGGTFVLPVFHGMGLDPKQATGTTALIALASSLSGFIARASIGSLDATFAAATAVAAGAGAALGSRIAIKRLSPSALKRTVAVILWVVAIKIVWDVVA